MSDPRPEPVTEAAKVAALVSSSVVAVGAAFVLIGWVTAEQVQAWAVVAGGVVTALGALLAYVMPIITARGARAQVTPLASPVGVDGVPLITDLGAAVRAAIPASSAAPSAIPAPSAPTEPVEITDALHALDHDATQPFRPDFSAEPSPTYDQVTADLAAAQTRPMAAVAAGVPAPSAKGA